MAQMYCGGREVVIMALPVNNTVLVQYADDGLLEVVAVDSVSSSEGEPEGE